MYYIFTSVYHAVNISEQLYDRAVPNTASTRPMKHDPCPPSRGHDSPKIAWSNPEFWGYKNNKTKGKRPTMINGENQQSAINVS